MKSILATLEAEVYRFRKTYRKVNYVITPSAFYKDKIEESGVFTCPVEHLTNFLPDSCAFADTPSIGEYFLYFGRLSREKGVETLVRAYAGLSIGQHTVRKLYIVGTGPMEEEIMGLIQELHMEDSVKMLGFRSGDELRTIVQKAFCVILPSEWYENGPYSIMEAMAAGRPVIVSSNGGLPELVEEGRNGYICRPGDSTDLCEKMSAINDLPEKKLLNMSDQSIAMAKGKFDRETYYESLLTCYQKIQSLSG